MDMRKYLDLFVSEANEHIQAAGNEVGRLASGLTAPETLNSLFRHFHSIKGMAASMGFEEIASLSHAVEDLFDRLRKGGEKPPEVLTDLVMEALDSTSAMVARASLGGAPPDGSAGLAALIERIRALLPPAPARREAPARPPASAGHAPAAAAAAAGRRLRCRVVIDPRAEFPGARAALALQRLEGMGSVLWTSPGREALQSADFGGEMALELATDRSEAAVAASVKDLLDLRLFDLTEAVEGPPAPARPGHAPAEPSGSAPSTVRIPTATLDAFLDALSEMITRRGALAEAIKGKDMQAAREALGKLSESIDDLRKQVMLIRLMPFDHISERLTRTVRDLCRRTGKRVALQIAGADVSLDRSVLEEIIDPLGHLLRNAVDHGIELPAERELRGKPASGVIRIDVSRAGDHVLIAVEDDGKGMDRDAIVRTALAGGFASESELAAMDEQQILLLTTIPGFSTATKVTEVSGRGVGMDIVRTRIEALHGHMRISSRRGQGTRIDLSLPLTVAVIDAFLVESGAGVFAVPAGLVAGVQMVDPRRIRRTLAGSYLAADDDAGQDPSRFVPLVSLNETFSPGASPGAAPAAGAAPVQVLAYQANGARGVLAVDRVRERREVVVKPLGPPLERLRKYSGAALLDDGTVALILDLVNLSRS